MATTITREEMQCKVKDFLKSLGTGPNKVAENLKEMKIKGYKAESDSCPIVKALRKNFKNLKGISTDSDTVEFDYRGEDCSVKVPSAVAKFVQKFDNNDYPELAFKEVYE
jgi:hypothetical protein